MIDLLDVERIQQQNKVEWIRRSGQKCQLPPSYLARVYIYICHKTTRVVKTCPPCMFDELEDIMLYLGKWLFDVTNDVTTP